MKTETFDANGAGERLSAAIEARGNLLRDAAVGLPVTTHQLRAAETAVKDAEGDAVLASEIAKHTKAEADRAQIAQRAAEAAAIAARKAKLVTEHIDAARALDAAMALARGAAAELRTVQRALEAVDAEAHRHNEAVKSDARTNAILASQHTSTWPKATVAGPLPVSFSGGDLRPELVALRAATPVVSLVRDVVEPRTAESIARGAHPPALVAA